MKRASIIYGKITVTSEFWEKRVTIIASLFDINSIFTDFYKGNDFEEENYKTQVSNEHYYLLKSAG